MSRIAAGRAHEAEPTLRRWPSCAPSQNSSTSLAQKAGRSSGLARGDQALVDDDLLVDPVAAGVADVGPQRRPRRDRAAAQHVGLDQRPRGVADRGDRLALLEEAADEGDGVLVHAQEVGVGDAARQHEAVVVGRVGVGDRAVDRERVGLVEVVEGLDLARLGGEQLGLAALALDRLPRLGQLDLLDALGGDEERDPLALKLVGHGGSSSVRGFPVAYRCSPACKRRRRGTPPHMGYVIAAILVLLIVAAGVTFFVLGAAGRKRRCGASSRPTSRLRWATPTSTPTRPPEGQGGVTEPARGSVPPAGEGGVGGEAEGGTPATPESERLADRRAEPLAATRQLRLDAPTGLR